MTEANHTATALPAPLQALTREQLNALPIRRYEGPIHVIAGLSDLRQAMPDLLGDAVVGFDTETRPAFRPGESYLPSLVQLATSRAVYLLRAQQTELFDGMREILSAAAVVKAGVSVLDDLRNLRKVFDFDDRSVLDLGRVARQHGLRQTGLRNLAGLLLGMRISKGAQTTNWAAPRLTPQQIDYAATDAWACRELYLRFRELGMA